MIELSEIEKFQLFCLENYKVSQNISGKQALEVFKKQDVFSFLASGYEVLHTQSIKYILDDIIEFINHNKG